MADPGVTNGSFSTSYVVYSGYNCYFTLEWSRTGYNAQANTHTIYYIVKFHYRSGHYRTLYYRRLKINDTEVYSSSTATSYYDGATICDGYYTLNSYNTDGNGWLQFYVDGYIGGSQDTYKSTGTQGYTVTAIDRTATITASEKSKTYNTISVNWSANKPCSYVQYSLNGGAYEWANKYSSYESSDHLSGYFEIRELSPSTTYTIKVKCARIDTSVYSESNSLSITTNSAQIGITASNINFGEDLVVTLTNPSSLTTNLTGTVNNTDIISQAITTGSNTITFTDEQLTDIFKEYGDISQSNTVTMVLTATATNGSTSTVNVAITFTGDRATIWYYTNNTWKKGIVWVKDNTIWKKGIVWKGVNGQWKKAL